MLFIGHFTFDEVDLNDMPKHGYFSSIVEAESPDAAVEKFERHIKRMRTDLPQMADVVKVYIEEILSIGRVPETPVITRLQSSDGEFPRSVSHCLPGTGARGIEAFGYAPDIDAHESPNDGGFIESQPFIIFER